MAELAQSVATSTKAETLCLVCGDKASGKHYGVLSCDGCRGFFKRSIRRNLAYVCKENGNCVVDVNRRNQCQSCRFRKCLEANMKKEAVQHERAPRLSCAPKTNFAGGMSDAEDWSSSTGVPNFFPYNAERPITCTPLNDEQRGAKYSRPSCQTVEAKEHVAIYEVNTTHSTESSHNLVLPYTHEYLSGQQFVSMAPDALLYAESVHETAARLLFLAVKWTRGVPAFLHLPFRDQAILLEEAWAELFVINAAQWSLPVDEGILLGNSGYLSLNCQSTLLTEARLLRETINRFTSMDIDNTEYACLKALVLFKPEIRGLRDPIQVEILQDQTHLMLQEYTAIKQPASKMRFGKLLLLLPSVHGIRASAIEDIFFRKTIGSIPIERLLCDMFKSG